MNKKSLGANVPSNVIRVGGMGSGPRYGNLPFGSSSVKGKGLDALDVFGNGGGLF